MRQLTASPALRAAFQLGLGSRRNGSLLCAATMSRHRLLGLDHRSGHSSRSSSSSSSNPAAQQPSSPLSTSQPQPPAPSPSPSPALAAIAAAVNPPATTRPPPLDLPEPDPKATAMKRVFGVGKAYLVFYKNGLRAILTNYRLNQAVLAQSAAPPPSQPPPATADGTPSAPRPESRAALQLGGRVGHDLRRVPVFLLIFAVFVELTPLVAVLVPRLVPLTCRIPKQELLLLRQAEDRRRASFQELSSLLLQPGAAAPTVIATTDAPADRGTKAAAAAAVVAVPETQKALDAADRHAARSLGLVSRAWDWGLVGGVPAALARRRLEAHLPVLALDDMKMLEAAAVALAAEALGNHGGGGGGVTRQAVVDAAVGALVDDEVRIACAARGVDTLGRPVEELRPVLAQWLRLVAEAGGNPSGPMRELLLSRPDFWPQTIPPGRKERIVLHMPAEGGQM
ncbi:hypothetical protein RB594_009672 [Gaeumannomyces avenae]